MGLLNVPKVVGRVPDSDYRIEQLISTEWISTKNGSVRFR